MESTDLGPQGHITCAEDQARVYNAVWEAIAQCTLESPWHANRRIPAVIDRFAPPFTVRDHERRVGKVDNALADHALANKQLGVLHKLIEQPDFDPDSLIAGQPVVLVCLRKAQRLPSQHSLLRALGRFERMPCITRKAVQCGAAQSQFVLAEAGRLGMFDCDADVFSQVLIDVLDLSVDVEWPESAAFRMGMGHMVAMDDYNDAERIPWVSTGPVGVPLHCEVPGVHWRLLTVRSVADIVGALRAQVAANPDTWANVEYQVGVLDEVVNEAAKLQLRFCWLQHVLAAQPLTLAPTSVLATQPLTSAPASVLAPTSVLLDSVLQDAVRMCISPDDLQDGTPSCHILAEYAVLVGLFL